jgi:hypothetical protein
VFWHYEPSAAIFVCHHLWFRRPTSSRYLSSLVKIEEFPLRVPCTLPHGKVCTVHLLCWHRPLRHHQGIATCYFKPISVIHTPVESWKMSVQRIHPARLMVRVPGHSARSPEFVSRRY